MNTATSPYTEKLNRYAEVKGKPQTLSAKFIEDLLEVTGGGKARDFETARDHAMIRILRSEGIRRHELLSMVMHTLPADLIKNPVFRLVPLKGARAAGQDRLVTLAPASARALAIYLRARRHHKRAPGTAVTRSATAGYPPAALVPGMTVVGAGTLTQVTGWLHGDGPAGMPGLDDPGPADAAPTRAAGTCGITGSADHSPASARCLLRGYPRALRAAEICAAGGHHCLCSARPAHR